MKIEVVFAQDDIAHALLEYVKGKGYEVSDAGQVSFTIDRGDPGHPGDRGPTISARVIASGRVQASQR